jgi:hypothetical protein
LSLSEKLQVQVKAHYRKIEIISEFAVKMAPTDPDQTPTISNQGTPSDLPGGSNGELHIPIPNDSGFYGYNEEKHLQHVSLPAHPLTLASNEIIHADGREVDRPT